MVERKIKGVPKRLGILYTSSPLYFVTFNTYQRKSLLANERVLSVFYKYADKGQDCAIGVGCFMIMPDHVHVFVRISGDISLGSWIKGLKHLLGFEIRREVLPEQIKNVWQPGFFDHVLRSDESYREKWGYVRMNPVRKGLVAKAEDWPYHGEIVRIDRA